MIEKEPAHVPGLLLPSPSSDVSCRRRSLARPLWRARRCCSDAPGAHRGRTGVSLRKPLGAAARCCLRADASGECLNSRGGNSAVASPFLTFSAVQLRQSVGRGGRGATSSAESRRAARRRFAPVSRFFRRFPPGSICPPLRFYQPADRRLFFLSPHSSFFSPTFGLFLPCWRLELVLFQPRSSEDAAEPAAATSSLLSPFRSSFFPPVSDVVAAPPPPPRPVTSFPVLRVCCPPQNACVFGAEAACALAIVPPQPGHRGRRAGADR